VGTWPDPVALENRFLRTGCGGYNVRPFDALARSFGRPDVQFEFFGAGPGELFAALPSSAPDAHFAKLADIRNGFELGLGLKAAAHDRGHTCIFARQIFCGHSTGRACANLSELVGLKCRQRESVRGPVKQNLKMSAGFCVHGICLQPKILRRSRGHVVKNRTSGQNNAPARMVHRAPIRKLVKSMLH